MDIREIIPAPVHRNLLLPVVESPRDVDLSSTVLPSKYRRYQLLCRFEYNETRFQRGQGNGGTVSLFAIRSRRHGSTLNTLPPSLPPSNRCGARFLLAETGSLHFQRSGARCTRFRRNVLLWDNTKATSVIGSQQQYYEQPCVMSATPGAAARGSLPFMPFLAKRGSAV